MSNQIDELETLRGEIDRIDDEVAELIAERIQVAEEVAAIKSTEEMNLVDTSREEDVKSHYEEIFRQYEVGAESGRDLAEHLIEVSIEREREIAGGS